MLGNRFEISRVYRGNNKGSVCVYTAETVYSVHSFVLMTSLIYEHIYLKIIQEDLNWEKFEMKNIKF